MPTLGTLPPPQVKLQPGFKPKWDKSAPPLGAWPPAGYRKPYKVTTGDTWLSVAMMSLIPDPLDVIEFNFGTTDPLRVNTYLHHYVGCSYPASDRKNFRFSDVDKPGVVYWPPLGYQRNQGGLPFHADVMTLLESELPRYPDLTLGDHRVTRLDLHVIVELMRAGRIGVAHVPDLDAAGKWSRRTNTLKVKALGVATWRASRTIIHEATHAINDYKIGAFGGRMRVWHDEFLAYTAAALWGRAKNDARAEQAVTSPGSNPINRDALILARYLRGGGGRMRASAMDTMLPDYRDPSSTINPVANLRTSIERGYPEWNHVYRHNEGI
jgi:hypothetical protein